MSGGITGDTERSNHNPGLLSIRNYPDLQHKLSHVLNVHVQIAIRAENSPIRSLAVPTHMPHQRSQANLRKDQTGGLLTPIIQRTSQWRQFNIHPYGNVVSRLTKRARPDQSNNSWILALSSSTKPIMASQGATENFVARWCSGLA